MLQKSNCDLSQGGGVKTMGCEFVNYRKLSPHQKFPLCSYCTENWTVITFFNASKQAVECGKKTKKKLYLDLFVL